MLHEEADTRPRCTDHLGQAFLRDLWNQPGELIWFAKLRHQQEYPRQAFLTGVEELVEKIGLGSPARTRRYLMNISERVHSSCITRSISSLSIFSTVQLLIEVAVDRCRALALASESSPTNSPAESRVIVASFPHCETTVTLARPVLQVKHVTPRGRPGKRMFPGASNR